MAGVSAARKAAFEVLTAVETRGAFVDEALHGRALDGLSDRDRGLASEIVLGVLRKRGTLDAMIERPARRPAGRIDLEPRTALRMAAYQMRYLDRVPARAAVNESVELVKRGPRRSASGFVNAVLRRLPERPTAERERELNAPRWLLDRWRGRFGVDRLGPLLDALQSEPRTWLRLDSRWEEAETLERLAADGVEARPAEGVAGAYELVAGRAQATAAWAEGRVRIQDVSSQAVVPLLGLAPGQRLLDLCAAPGGKSRQSAETLGEAAVVACDLHPHRLRRMRELGGAEFRLVALDARAPLPFGGMFERILIDAPCSGTGTLARNPDIAWRLRPGDVDDLGRRQEAILRRGLAALAPGGALVYSTCSLEPEENEQVVERALEGRADLTVAERLERLPGREAGEGFQAFRIERS